MDSIFTDLHDLLPLSREKSAKNMDEARNYLFIDLENIARIIRAYNPLEVLKMAAWE